MKYRSILSTLIILNFLLVPQGLPSSKYRQKANYDNLYKIYSPAILNGYRSTPTATISHYISFGLTELTYQNFYDMGKTMGQSLSPGFNGYVILQFGKPAREGSSYKVLDYAYELIPINDVEFFIRAYLSGFVLNSTGDVFLNLVLGTTNQGQEFSNVNDPMGFGQVWGLMISNLTNWINSPPSYAGKVSVMAGVDNELPWNNAQKSFNWRSGYLGATARPYLYYGDCASCPFYGAQNWTPEPYGWTLEQVYSMTNTSNGFALPQIYRVDWQNADQWYYLSLYIYLQGYEPIGFLGSLTQSSACGEVGGCAHGMPDAIDNAPDEGWRQLWGNIFGDSRTSKNLSGVPFEISISSDISWNHWKVSYP